MVVVERNGQRFSVRRSDIQPGDRVIPFVTGGGGGARPPPKPKRPSVRVSGSTVFIGGKGFSVKPGLQEAFIRERGGVVSPSLRESIRATIAQERAEQFRERAAEASRIQQREDRLRQIERKKQRGERLTDVDVTFLRGEGAKGLREEAKERGVDISTPVRERQFIQEVSREEAEAQRQKDLEGEKEFDPRTGKPFGVVEPAPTFQERFEESREFKGPIRGSLDFFQDEIKRIIDKQEQSGFLKQEPGRTFPSADIGFVPGVARIAPLFTPVGPALLVGEGVESFVTPAGKESRQAFVEKFEGGVLSESQLKKLSFAPAVAETALGLTGLGFQARLLKTRGLPQSVKESLRTIKERGRVGDVVNVESRSAREIKLVQKQLDPLSPQLKAGLDVGAIRERTRGTLQIIKRGELPKKLPIDFLGVERKLQQIRKADIKPLQQVTRPVADILGIKERSKILRDTRKILKRGGKFPESVGDVLRVRERVRQIRKARRDFKGEDILGIQKRTRDIFETDIKPFQKQISKIADIGDIQRKGRQFLEFQEPIRIKRIPERIKTSPIPELTPKRGKLSRKIKKQLAKLPKGETDILKIRERLKDIRATDTSKFQKEIDRLVFGRGIRKVGRKPKPFVVPGRAFVFKGKEITGDIVKFVRPSLTGLKRELPLRKITRRPEPIKITFEPPPVIDVGRQKLLQKTKLKQKTVELELVPFKGRFDVNLMGDPKFSVLGDSKFGALGVLRTRLDFPTRPKPRRKPLVKEAEIPKAAIKPRVRLRTIQRPKTKARTREEEKARQRSLQRSLQSPVSISLTRQRELTRQRVRTLLRTPQVTRPPKRMIVPPPPIPFPTLKPRKRKVVTKPRTRSYSVFAKPQKSKKFVKVNINPLRKNDALSMGSYVTDTSLGADFKIKPSGKEPKTPLVNFPTNYWNALGIQDKFRDFKIVKGKKKKLKNRYIEKKGKRLDTPQEKKKITLARRLKQLKKKTPTKKTKRKK